MQKMIFSLEPNLNIFCARTALWPWRLVTGLLPQSPGFDPRAVHVEMGFSSKYFGFLLRVDQTFNQYFILTHSSITNVRYTQTVSPFNAVDNNMPLIVYSHCQAFFITKSLRCCVLSIFHSKLLNVCTLTPMLSDCGSTCT
jgi:hypothetical protein